MAVAARDGGLRAEVRHRAVAGGVGWVHVRGAMRHGRDESCRWAMRLPMHGGAMHLPMHGSVRLAVRRAMRRPMRQSMRCAIHHHATAV